MDSIRTQEQMIATINRTRIINWIAELKPNVGYKGYTLRLLDNLVVAHIDNPDKEFLVCYFIFYSKKGNRMKRIDRHQDDKTPVDDLAKAIIDFDGDFI